MKGISQALLWEGAGVGDGGIIGEEGTVCIYSSLSENNQYVRECRCCMLVEAPAPDQALEPLVVRGNVRGQGLVASCVPDHFENLRHF